MAISLLYGLLDSKGEFSLDKIAKYYRIWLLSNPFDIGLTVSRALQPLSTFKDQDQDPSIGYEGPNSESKGPSNESKDPSSGYKGLSGESKDLSSGYKGPSIGYKDPRSESKHPLSRCKGWSKAVISTSAEHNLMSQSNGGLMRLTPLAIWSSRLLDLTDFETVIRAEQSLTHPSELVQLAGVAYCLAIRTLLISKGNITQALSEVEQWIKAKQHQGLIEWWEVSQAEKPMPATKNIGWAKIAWTYSFYYLKHPPKTFLGLMREVISKGGDTDTNACIVGGLIGASMGYKRLEEECNKQIKILLECDVSKARRSRPKELGAGEAYKKIEELVKMAPEKLRIVEG